MQYIIDELGNVKTTNIGPNNDGFNVLNIPDELYKGLTKDQFGSYIIRLGWMKQLNVAMILFLQLNRILIFYISIIGLQEK
jgi:hypothetical protein